MTTQIEMLNYVFNEVKNLDHLKMDEPHEIERDNKAEKRKWYCHKCDARVNGLENYQANGKDDTDLASVQCERCGLTLWQD